jgi:multiple sugar transport system ATP-binding protein
LGDFRARLDAPWPVPARQTPAARLTLGAMASVLIENLSKRYPTPHGAEVRAVDQITLTVESGELLVLVGPSGSGKTTLLRMIAGLEKPSGGELWIDGENVTAKPPAARDVAMVFQEHSLYPHMTIRRNLAFGLVLRKFGKAEIADRVREAANLLGLTGLLDRLPQSLSGGERQRVALGRAMVLRPKVFLLDEPLSNLDAPLRAQMRREIALLHRRLGATMIYVTHDQIEAMTLAERLAVVRGGALQQVAQPEAVYDRPANLFVAGFIGAPPMNFFQGVLAQEGQPVLFRGEQTPGTVTLAFELDQDRPARFIHHCGRRVIFGLRPEHIRPLGSGESNAPGEVLLEAEVTGIEPLGWETHLSGTGCGYSFVARVGAARQIEIGQHIVWALDMSKAEWFDAESGHRLA